MLPKLTDQQVEEFIALVRKAHKSSEGITTLIAFFDSEGTTYTPCYVSTSAQIAQTSFLLQEKWYEIRRREVMEWRDQRAAAAARQAGSNGEKENAH